MERSLLNHRASDHKYHFYWPLRHPLLVCREHPPPAWLAWLAANVIDPDKAENFTSVFDSHYN